MAEEPLIIDVAGVRLEADAFEDGPRRGWTLRREAVIDRGQGPMRVEVEVRVVELGVADDERGVPWAGVEEQQLAELVAGRLARTELNKGGSSVSFRLDLGGGLRASYRPEQINPHTVPRKEVAAYELARLLGITAVPPVTFRTFTRSELLDRLAPDARVLIPRIDAEVKWSDGATSGSLAVWVPRVVDSRLDTWVSIRAWTEALKAGAPAAARPNVLFEQLSTLLLFDRVINNEDRFTGGNVLMSPSGRTLYILDNSYSFSEDAEGHARCVSFLRKCQQFSARLVGALRDLDESTLRRSLGPDRGLLTDPECTALMRRREGALRYIDDLCHAHGEEKVLTFR